ncbi:hypothetical protein ACHAPT_013242 [Fusarium lateritium]
MPPGNTGRLPVAGPVASFWNANPKKLDDYRSTSKLPSTSDIVIIGSGLSGVATAYFLLADHPDPSPPSIVLLEARQICSGATGRNGGHIKPDTYSDIPKFAKLFGIQTAAHLAEFEASHVGAVKNLVEKEGLDCDFHMTRALDVYLDPMHAKKVEDTYRKIVEDEIVNLSDVTFTPKEHAERISGVKNAQACISYTAAHLWPSKLVHQLLEKLIDQGLNVQAHTPVTSVSKDEDVLGYSFDFMPHIGEVPGKPGQFIIAGFTGYGMPKILLSSKGLARMVRHGASFEETGLPTPFKTTRERNESKTSPLEDSLRSLWVDKAKL